MLRALQDRSWTAWRPPLGAVVRWAEIGLVLILAWQAARLVWIVLAPAGPLGAATVAAKPAPQPDYAVFARFDPFFRNLDAGAAPAASAPGGLALYGVRADGRGGGSAIIGAADGSQASYALGEDLGGGLMLTAIAADHVILTRGGGRTRLEFVAGEAPPPPPPPTFGAVLPAATPGASAAPGLDPRQFLAAAALTPESRDGRVVGYRVMSRARGGGALREAGLQEGDLVLAIDGSPLNPERMSELPDLLAAAQGEVEVRFERNGQPMTTRLRTVTR
ncbi:MAG: type II secretion system protein N [Phenylobacterium sp.]|uniref:type II secretion system protein N n=1 Tax=Phenylobacterium sp. TaxID=1871053 RepID=UPI003918E648